MRINKSLVTNQVTGAGTGSVTSVAMTVPTGLTITGSPITSSGTLALGFASGVALPPSQTGNAGKYLTTDGTSLSWGNISGSISGTANYVPFFATSSTLGTSPLYYDGSYYMAIGTTTTGTGRLQIYSTNADEHLQLSGTAPSLRLTDIPFGATYNQVIGQAITANNYITNTVAGDLAIANASGGSILFGIGSAEKLRIFTSTGNVSINGTSTDTGDKLYVSGGIKATAQLKLTGYTSTSAYPGTAAGFLAFDSSGNILSLAGTGGVNIYNTDGSLTGNRALTFNSYPLTFIGTTTTYFFSSGNIRIGGINVDLGYKLHVSGTDAIINNVRVGQGNANGSQDVAVGQSALNVATVSGASTAVGYNSLVVQSTGYRNTAIGANSGSSITTGIQNTFVGVRSGAGITTGSNNIHIGYVIGIGITTGSNNTIIGSNISGLSTTLANNIVISDGSGNQRINGNSTGGIGIGTGTSISASAQFEILSTTRGFLPPRMTNAQRTAITSPAVGLIVYCTDATEGLYVYKSGGWTFII